jgi:hypothetical protein
MGSWAAGLNVSEKPVSRRLKPIDVNDRPFDLLASTAFVNDVDALSRSQSPLHEGENTVLVTGRIEKHIDTSAEASRLQRQAK